MNEIQAVKTAKIEEVKKNSKKGFTLVELVVVIAILAILAAIAIPVVSSTTHHHREVVHFQTHRHLSLLLKRLTLRSLLKIHLFILMLQILQ